MKVLITGASGFLGSHIAKQAVCSGHEILSLMHSEYDTCIYKVNTFAPDVLIHCAWGGVSAADRNNPSLQDENIASFKQIISLYPFKQIIGLGSQDEYGYIDQVVAEDYPLNPTSCYAKAKVDCCNHLKKFAEEHCIEWQWLRIFNMYGSRQAQNWLIPSIISKCLAGEKSMQTTLGEQKYAYLNAEDFAQAVVSIIGKQNVSGVYNISASKPVPLREIFETIRTLTNSKISFEFGAIPYRENQSMMICGNSFKFKSTFGEFEKTSFLTGLTKLINEIKVAQA